MSEADAAAQTLPLGEYAIVELFGHTTLVGRVAEVERFGAKMLVIEPLFRDELLAPVFHGGAAIYRFTPCSAEVAQAQQPRRSYQLPDAVRCIVPPLLLATPERGAVVDAADAGEEDGDEPHEDRLF